jgi:uncharacterized membrane protein
MAACHWQVACTTADMPVVSSIAAGVATAPAAVASVICCLLICLMSLLAVLLPQLLLVLLLLFSFWLTQATSATAAQPLPASATLQTCVAASNARNIAH